MHRLTALSQSYFKIASYNLKYTIYKGKLNYKILHHKSKIPETPVEDLLVVPKSIENIDQETIKLLEHLSLVNLENTEALQILQSSIKFVQKIFKIYTCTIKPLYTVLENQPLVLRLDQVRECNIRKDILCNAKVITEDYFVIPLGNIPLK